MPKPSDTNNSELGSGTPGIIQICGEDWRVKRELITLIYAADEMGTLALCVL